MVNEQYVCFEMLEDDIHSVQKAYSCWESSKHESPADFIARKRAVDLVCLLNEVIEKELTEIEQNILRMFYFENLSVSEIANELCLHRSTIARRIEGINEKIYCNLKYAVKYEYDQYDDCIVPLAVREALALCAVRSSKPNNVGGRILKLRTIAKISCYTLSQCTNITQKRLMEIENGYACINVDEAVCLAAFFCVSTDYLLTGKEQNKN